MMLSLEKLQLVRHLTPCDDLTDFGCYHRIRTVAGMQMSQTKETGLPNRPNLFFKYCFT
jgi:hypothetical protein